MKFDKLVGHRLLALRATDDGDLFIETDKGKFRSVAEGD